MAEITTLKGIAWDHPRGYQPLRATSALFAEMHPEVSIQWDIRSLKEFGDMPIEALIDHYDLITIDHPYMGQAYANGLLLSLSERLPHGVVKELENQSVGASYKSYYYKGHLYALPIDAAALVSASRNDVISELDLKLPKTRKDLLAFYKGLPGDYAIAWPLCPTDLWCSFLTLCAQDAGRDFIDEGTIEEKTGIPVLDELKHHLGYLHPESINWNPIQILDRMGAEDEIIYSPYLFGYSNYSRVGYTKNVLNFTNSPKNPEHDVSTVLGGVGLAISSNCHHPDSAVAFITYVANAETQKTVYTENGGQPGSLKAWQSGANNALCSNFFCDTQETMEKAYVRPQHRGWNRFQEQGADLLHNGLVKDIPSKIMIKDLNQLYRSIL